VTTAFFALGSNVIVDLVSYAGRTILGAGIVFLAVGAYPSVSKEALAATDEAPKPRLDCAITFDDGPGRFTEQLLDTLKKKQAVATFFVLGELVQRAPQLVLRIAAEGHEIDNHSFDHPDLRHLDYRSQKAEIDKTERALLKLGITPKYFRPPYGSYNADTVRAAGENGLVLALWTVDGLDWKYHTVHALEARFEQGIERKIGGIYLFHDSHSWTVAAIPDILDDLERKGCRFVTLGEYMNNRESKSSPDVSPPARDGAPDFEDPSAGEL
jgi:peptidoglycan/xylan/chitin deacetylase (PgdA/CDA1 family)